MIPELRDRFARAAEIAKGHKRIHLFSHYDADGISSLSIVASALERCSIEYTYDIFPTLGVEQVEKVSNTECECFIMTDMGTSFLEELGSLGKDCVILDHHEPLVDTDRENVAYVNCHNADIDGSFEVCAATMAYLFAQAMGDNSDLVRIAIAGMIGDKQHIGGFKGVNSRIVEKGVEEGYLIRSERTIIPSGDLVTALSESVDPYVVGLSGDIEAAEELVSATDDREELERKVISMLKDREVSDTTIEECIQYRYYLPFYDMDAERLSRIIDSCGRAKKGSEGVALCVSGRNDNAESVYKGFNDTLLVNTGKLVERGTIRLENIQYFFNDVYGISGTMAGIFSRYVGDPNVPIIGLYENGDNMDVSSRCTQAALDNGVNLATAMRLGAGSVGGQGGGHINAAGATVPKDRTMDFLKEVDRIVGSQISGKKE